MTNEEMESPASSSVAGGKNPDDVVRRAAVVEAAYDYAAAPRRRRVVLPVVLFVATCLSTFWTGAVDWHPERQAGCVQRAAAQFQLHWQRGESGTAVWQAAAALVPNWQRGLVYMLAVMGILLTHEMGHFLMALRYHVPASLPFFIPVPVLPFGTMGAVIGLDGLKADRREMFDLGIAGPLAGLAVALPVICLGILQLNPAAHPGSGIPFFSPLILRLMIGWLRPDFPTPEILYMSEFNPLLMAGWVGMLVTGLNMVPLSQLDGGHVAYALLGRHRAHTLARVLVVAAIVSILLWEAYIWVVMLTLVIFMGIHHPPTADDRVPLGWPRRVLGYASLAIPILCFPPMRIT